MGSLFFVCGSVAGAVVAWLIGRRDRSRSMIFVLDGVACGLLGVVMSASGDTMTPATEAGLGLLGTVAPLTLCVTTVNPVATSAGISSAVRHFTANLGFALVCGISCAILGFVSVESVRYIGVKENEGKADYPIMISPKPSGELNAVFARGL